jgi:hypothetical protein
MSEQNPHASSTSDPHSIRRMPKGNATALYKDVPHSRNLIMGRHLSSQAGGLLEFGQLLAENHIPLLFLLTQLFPLPVLPLLVNQQ